MNEPAQLIEIERLILADLGVTPERAERIRKLMEIELKRLLEAEEWPDEYTGGEVSHLDLSLKRLTGSYSDHYLASVLAESIAQAIQSVGQ